MDNKEIQVEQSVDHNEPNGNFDRSWRDQQWTRGQSVSQEAQQQSVSEADLGPAEAIKYFKPGLGWSLVFSTCVIMEGVRLQPKWNSRLF